MFIFDIRVCLVFCWYCVNNEHSCGVEYSGLFSDRFFEPSNGIGSMSSVFHLREVIPVLRALVQVVAKSLSECEGQPFCDQSAGVRVAPSLFILSMMMTDFV